MNAVSIISVCFGGISLLVSIVIFIRTITRDSRKDTEAEVRSKDEIKSSLLKLSLTTENINTTTNDIKADVKSLTKNVNDMDTRLQLVEREQATMWKKYDELKEKVNG